MNLKIISVLGVLSCICTPALAQDADDIEYEEDFIEEEIEAEPEIETRTISARMTCAEINARITELREEIKSDPDLESELNTMLARQRTQCATKSRRRSVRNYAKPSVATVSVPEVKEEQPSPAPTQEPEVAPEDVVLDEQRAAENIARGLCPNGEKPNKFGCCAGERFKQVSTMQYACCPKEGDGDCFEPLKK